MTDDEFKRHLYKKLAEDKQNEGILTNRIYNKPYKAIKNNGKVTPKKSR